MIAADRRTLAERRGRIANFEIPRTFVSLHASEWPQAASGKMDRPALCRLAAGRA